MKMNHGIMVRTLWQVDVPGEFRISPYDDDLWLQYVDPSIGPEANGRKWRISEHATKSEVVQTAFMAYLAWLEHEARETFRYRGEAIFGPHFDVDTLAVLAASSTNYDVRTPA